jgi:methylglutaconyl-CoA hydratase
MILQSIDGAIATISLNDPAKRNALSLPMFEALDHALASIASDATIQVVVLRGEGAAFCAGFDLGAAVDEPDLLSQYISRLSLLNRALRRLPQVVVAAVHGAAIAGGCAIVSACDFIVVAADAKLGYPVHALGISPAVTIPTLRLAIGDGAARALLMSGELIDGIEAHRRGLATDLASSSQVALAHAMERARALAQKPPAGLRTTKAWLNQLDGSLSDAPFDATARDSAAASTHHESRGMLRAFWSRRT